MVQRSLANNCFILSLNIYQSTYFGFNWNDVNLYQQRSAKLILGRVWLATRYLPHIFRWLRIAPALDPAITLTTACLGYWFRQNGSSALLSPGYSDVEMRQGAVVQQVFRAWLPLLGADKVGNLLRIVAGQYSRQQHLRFLQQLKLSLHQTIQEHALSYLRSRVNLQLLPGGVSWTWLSTLASLPKLAANGVARYAVPRWAVNEDDDECLRLRTQGDLHAEQPCQWCAVPTRLYPLGLNSSPACEQCCFDHGINATTLHNHDLYGAFHLLHSGTHWPPLFGDNITYQGSGHTTTEICPLVSRAEKVTTRHITGHVSASCPSLSLMHSTQPINRGPHWIMLLAWVKRDA